MFDRYKGFALALIAPFLLVGCAFNPGKFVSTLTILADRSFTYSYQGEVMSVDMAAAMAKAVGEGGEDGEGAENSDASFTNVALNSSTDSESSDTETKNKAIAEALTKEAGYRSVVYKGNGLFEVDYAISGTLTHGFMWPYNLDAEVIFPFIAVEVRGADQVRVKAPGFAGNDKTKETAGEGNDKLNGSFTLITDGELISQNNESGATTTGNRRSITWKATPLTKDAPMAVIRINPRS